MKQICINASYQLEDIVNAAPPGMPFFFQLYVNKDRTATEALLKRVWEAGIRVLFLTVDAPVPGKREADEKVKTSAMIKTPMTGTQSANDNRGSGLTRIMGTYIDDQLSWADLQWLRTIWRGKIVLKGVQSVEDAIMAVEAGLDGITLR
jgi:L-lactate dehydrogenase (cytochrome)